MVAEPLVLDRDDGVLHIHGHIVEIHPHAVGAAQRLLFFKIAVFVLNINKAGFVGDVVQIRQRTGAIEFGQHERDHNAGDQAAGDDADQQNGQQAFAHSAQRLAGVVHRRLFHKRLCFLQSLCHDKSPP